MSFGSAYAQAIQELLPKVSQAPFGPDVPDADAPVTVVVAGGAAVHAYTGARVSKDLDAEFLATMLRPDDLDRGLHPRYSASCTRTTLTVR